MAKSYLDSPMYQRMLAQTLQGNGGGPQYPAQATGNALAQMLQAYALKQYGQQADARDAAGNKALADVLAPPEFKATGQNAVEASVPLTFEGIGGRPQQTTLNAGLPDYADANAEKNAQLVALLGQGIGKEESGKQALKGLGFGPTVDPKDRYMNVPGVGMVDLMAEGGPKPVVRERLKAGPGDVYLDQKDDGTLAPGYTVKDPNKAFNADGSPNTAYQNYELTKAATGKPSTTVTVNPENPFATGMAGGAVDILKSSNEAARGAVDVIRSAQEIKAAIDTGLVSGGPGASAAQTFRQLFGGDQKKLLATRAVIQNSAKIALASRGKLKGQGSVTEPEQALLIRADSPDIDNMSTGEIRQVTDIAERLARISIQQNRQNVERASKIPGGENIVPFYDVPEPPAYAPRKPQGAGQSQSAAIPDDVRNAAAAELARRRAARGGQN